MDSPPIVAVDLAADFESDFDSEDGACMYPRTSMTVDKGRTFKDNVHDFSMCLAVFRALSANLNHLFSTFSYPEQSDVPDHRHVRL